MSNPIYNPMVPFTMGVNLYPGLMIHVNGTPTGGRFSVNLITGHEENSDFAFHFNPRFDEGNVIVRNSKTNGIWNAEERQLSYFPFAIGQPFQMIILCQQNQFKVAVNGRHLLEFRHRLAYQSVRSLFIKGAVSLSMIRTEQEYPSQPSAAPAAPAGTSRILNNPVVPCTAMVPFNNIRNHRVIISGVPLNQQQQRFSIDIMGAGNEIFLHINPRFGERQIVRNSKFGGSWGNEERQLSIPFPFQYGVPYQITIHVEQPAFRIEVNSMEVFRYVHRRRPLNQIRKICINGATSVSRVEFQ